MFKFTIFISLAMLHVMQAATILKDSTKNSIKKKSETICETPKCSHWASKISENLNRNVNPCDNFYDFACGGFSKANELPDNAVEVSSFTKISDRIEIQIKEMLEEPIQENELRPIVLAKQMYNYCTDLQSIENVGLEPVKIILKRLGGWPVVEGSDWIEENFNWETTTYNIYNEGIPINKLLDISVGSDILNSSQNIIYVDQATLPLDRAFLLKGFDDRKIKAQYNFIVGLAEILGAQKENALREMREVVDFEIELAKITVPSEEMRNHTLLINYMTVQELQTKFPSISWVKYINSAIKEGEVEVSHQDVVNVVVPQYVSDLEVLLSGTSERVLHNYLIYEVVASNIDFYSSKALFELHQEFIQNLFNSKIVIPRWKSCVDIVSTTFHIAVGAQYVRKYFSDKSKEEAEQLIESIRAAFHHILVNIDWMDKNTKAEAIKKETAISTHVAYPQELLDDKIVEKYYAKMNFSATNYHEVKKQATRFHLHLQMSKLRKTEDENNWTKFSSATDVNAYYAPNLNTIIIPAGILQEEFFESDRPHYMNYGSMGFVIGHEITHGFDDVGRQYDANGIVADWWDEETKQLFIEKAQCIIDQYNNYTVPKIEININGFNTQGENIADNGGIKQAYLAYEKWIKHNGEEPQLPGLDYTSKQMFWISAANLWCSNSLPEVLKLFTLTNSHSPSPIRIIGPLSNSEYFSKDFNCPEGSPMNPTKKCQVW